MSFVGELGFKAAVIASASAYAPNFSTPAAAPLCFPEGSLFHFFIQLPL